MAAGGQLRTHCFFSSKKRIMLYYYDSIYLEINWSAKHAVSCANLTHSLHVPVHNADVDFRMFIAVVFCQPFAFKIQVQLQFIICVPYSGNYFLK